jgi:hypothetical protein
MSDLSRKLAAALGIEPPTPPCEVQLVFNRFKKHLAGRVISTPIEEIHLFEENFPYLIQLENPDPTDAGEWVSAKASVVIPVLEKGCFDQTGFRFEPLRTKALFNLPEFLQKPNCIHRNLRHDLPFDEGQITGEHMYVAYYGKKQRKVAFTTKHSRRNKIILVSSFWCPKKWVREGADIAVHVGEGCTCNCKIEKATSKVALSTPVTLGPE